jgi:mRNA-degrading endonuclease RelE of RelBE toxin-antitoxin system
MESSIRLRRRLGRTELYSSHYIDEALEDIKKLPKNVRNALRSEFKNKIHVDPVGCSEALTGPLGGYRRFHYREYRVIYRVFEEIKAVAVAGVGKKDKHHKAEVYKQLETLAASGKIAQAVLDTCRSISGPRSAPRKPVG